MVFACVCPVYFLRPQYLPSRQTGVGDTPQCHLMPRQTGENQDPSTQDIDTEKKNKPLVSWNII